MCSFALFFFAHQLDLYKLLLNFMRKHHSMLAEKIWSKKIAFFLVEHIVLKFQSSKQLFLGLICRKMLQNIFTWPPDLQKKPWSANILIGQNVYGDGGGGETYHKYKKIYIIIDNLINILNRPALFSSISQSRVWRSFSVKNSFCFIKLSNKNLTPFLWNFRCAFDLDQLSLS